MKEYIRLQPIQIFLSLYLILMIKLTNNAISTMFSQGSGKGDRFVVQALNVKMKDDYLRMDIKDASTTVKAVLYLTRPSLNILQNCKKINNEERYLIKIIEFKTHSRNEKTMLEIIDFSPLTQIMPPSAKIQQFTKQSLKNEVKNEENPEHKTEKKEASNNRRPIQNTSFDRINSRAMEDQSEEMSEDQLKKFQKISDLYIGFQGTWEIVVRVIQKSYREFNSKSGKLTKIFNMVMIDRTGMKIEGVMFGDNAKDTHDMIRLGHIYRVSRGQMREENYNQTKGKDCSRFNIVFNNNSVFVPVKDISAIPKANQSDITLEEIIQENNFDKTYNFTAMLLDIGEERQIEKGDRTIYKKSFLIGDPETKKSIDLVVWNKDMYLNPMWLGKAVMLKNFKLHNYRESLSFSSIFRSQIVLNENHRFRQYEGRYSKQEYEPISERKDEKVQDNKFTRHVRDIESQLLYANGVQPIYSDLEVYITHMSFKSKWFYDACNNPKCKKAAESGQKCLNCGHFNEIVQRRFIIPIEVSDCTGSIWTTAFDELSHEIFKGMNIQELSKMEEVKLKEEAECRLYQQFKLRISSKKELEGNIKHSIVGKVSEMNIQKASISNVEKIKKALF